MSPEQIAIAATVLAVVAIFLGGVYACHRAYVWRITYLEDEQRRLLDQLAAALADQGAGREAARSMVEAARKVAAARIADRGDPGARHRLLLAESDEFGESSTPPGGETA